MLTPLLSVVATQCTPGKLARLCLPATGSPHMLTIGTTPFLPAYSAVGGSTLWHYEGAYHGTGHGPEAPGPRAFSGWC